MSPTGSIPMERSGTTGSSVGLLRFWRALPKSCRRYLLAGTRNVIDKTLREAQGWYTDGWATTKLHYMLPAGGHTLCINGSLPDLGPPLHNQRLDVFSGSKRLASLAVPFGDF